MRPLLAHYDGVLADAILIPPRPPIPHTNFKKVRGLQKCTRDFSTISACKNAYKIYINPWLFTEVRAFVTLINAPKRSFT